MASRYLRQLEQAGFKRLFETAAKPIVQEFVDGNIDENTAINRILKLIHRIPGLSLVANVLFSAGGEFLAEHADELWLGDNRPQVVALRTTLRHAGPLIVGATDATTGVLDDMADKAADQVRSPASLSPGVAKAALDAIFFFVHEGKKYLLIPLRNPATGALVSDEWENPIPTNPEVYAVYNLDCYIKPVMRTEKGGKDGKQTRQVKGPPEKKRILIGPLTPLQAAQQNLFDLTRFPLEEAEEIKALLKPTPSWESLISPDVDRVLSWLVDVLSFAPLGLKALERQEVEELVQKMKAQKPEPDWVNRRLGRFRVEVDRFPLNKGRTYNDAQVAQIRTLLSRIRDELDITLEGEQSLMTQARKGLEAAPDVLRQVGGLLTTSTPWVVAGLLWWRNAVIAAFILLLLGILMPVSHVAKPWFTLTTLLLAVAGGIIGFAITWPFPLVQKVYDFLQKFIGGTSVDTINSLGRRIASFVLCVGAGVLPLTIWLEFPIISRAGIVAFGALFPIGIMFGLRELGYPDVASRMAKRSLLVANLIFGTCAVVTMALVGFVWSYTGTFMSGPQFVKWSVDHSVTGASVILAWLASLAWWHWGALIALVVVTILFVAILFGGSKESGSSDRAITLASILGGFALIAALCGLGFAGLDKIGSWFDNDPATVTVPEPATVKGAPADAMFDRSALCSDRETPFDIKKDLGCL